jgi:predicted ATPase
MVIRASGSFDPRIGDHVGTILQQLRFQADRFGIGEAESKLQDEWYPANAFHTYWTLEIFELIEVNFPSDYRLLSVPRALNLQDRRNGMLLWARQRLGSQLGLHSASPPSSMLDSDQLAWSLAIFLRFDRHLSVNLENRDFIKQALKCLFSTQTDGTWRHYRPLFHYKNAGNAYCYVFETFAALLQCALQPGARAEMVRELLKPYCSNLMDLWRYADSTKIPIKDHPDSLGWCSGHRTNITEPESWASASVFSYAQALRRLIGIWCREDAFNALNARHNRRTPEQATDQMVSRGETWGTTVPVSERLWAMFINPARMLEPGGELEPDSQPIDEQHARSAILFGPPGTGKTTLVRLLADVIRWRYVELHASHFVADGLTQVQKTADRIFNELAELDHAVVLFDEIDELVREREMEEDAFGRFLTTSMLPKLAELWEARKILYFVATNHINYFDSAIVRSHRFDALILVSPPSFRAKMKQLKALLSNTYGLPDLPFETQEHEIQEKLDRVEKPRTAGTAPTPASESAERLWREEKLEPQLALAKFALLRYDELNELACRLASILKYQSQVPQIIPTAVLEEALKAIADAEWRKNKSYADYLRDVRSERRDYQMQNVWEVQGDAQPQIPGLVEANRRKWLVSCVGSAADIDIPGFQLRSTSPGVIEICSK